jgi:signal transduction histidine kinase
MGLAFCKKIIEKQGVSIWVESELGKGSIFYFTLPNNSSIPIPRARKKLIRDEIN